MNTRNGKISRGLPQRVALHVLLAVGACGAACSTPLEVPDPAPPEAPGAPGAPGGAYPANPNDAALPADAGRGNEPVRPPPRPTLDAGLTGGTVGGPPDTGVSTGGGFGFAGGSMSGGGLGVWIFPWSPDRPCEDDDGLPSEVERNAGFNPCARDSDSDGCDDAREFLLGGCDDPRNVLVQQACYGDDAAVSVRFTAPARDAGSWTTLTLLPDPARGVRITALANDSSSPAASGASFRDVPPGAVLLFDVAMEDLLGRPGNVQLLLTGDDGLVVDRGKVVFLPQECPIVI